MQTFLPYPGFVDSARVLDDRRLGKQRVETFQVLRALTWPTYGWKNHPVSKMWRGFVPALVAYGLACIDAWERRGRADATRAQLLEFTGGWAPTWEELLAAGQLPPWLGFDAFHVSHQSSLRRKDPEFYAPLFPGVPDDLPYVWPTSAFPRWPLLRQGREALPLATAAALLGVEPSDEQRDAVFRVADGEDATVTMPAGDALTTTGLLAGLCTPGRTLWVTPGPALPRGAGTPGERLPRVEASKTSVSIARAPGDDAALAMRELAEAARAPEFAFCRPELVAAAMTGTSGRDVGLVVVEADAGIAAVTLPETARRRPVLTLLRVPAAVVLPDAARAAAPRG